MLRDHAEIVRAHANRDSPKSAALPFPQGSHSLGRYRHVFSVPSESKWKTFPEFERAKKGAMWGWHGRHAAVLASGGSLGAHL